MYQRNFLGKIYLNVLADMQPRLSDDLFLDHARDTNHLGSRWCEAWHEKKKRFKEANNIEEEWGVLRASKFLVKADYAEFIEIIRKELPMLDDDWMLSRNTLVIAELLELTRVETLILELAMKLSSSVNYYDRQTLHSLSFGETSGDMSELYARLFNVDVAETKKALQGFLIKSAFLVPGNDPRGLYKVNHALYEAFAREDLTVENIEEHLFPTNLSTELTTDDYPHFVKEIGITESIINKSLAEKSRGTNVMLWGKAGTGKAQPLFSKVRTPSGWVTMADVREGTVVATPDGGAAPVTGIFPQGKKKIFRITFGDGRQAECCEDHLWKVYNFAWKAREKIISLRELAERLQKTSKRPKYYVPLTKPVAMDRKELPIDPYLLGFLLGDGNFSGKGVRFSTADDELLRKVESRLPEGCSVKKYESARPYDYNIVGNQFIVPRLRALGLIEKMTSEHKFIPDVYLNASVEQRFELLQGLLDTDGTVDKNGSISYSTASINLMKGVTELVRSLGGLCKVASKRTTFTYNGERKSGMESLRLSIRHPDAKRVFSLARKLERLPKNYQYASLRLLITSIECIGEYEAQCIMIDHPDHLYITDEYVVTHNTELALALCQKNGWDLKVIGDISDGANEEKSRTQRMTSLKVAMKLYAKSDNVVLLFDEMEDLFRDQNSSNFSKAFVNRIIETTNIPIIWTTNDLLSLGSAVLRRMVYNIGFDTPPISARKKIWQTCAKKYELDLDADTIDQLATDYDMVPALINNAAKITQMSGLETGEIKEVLTSLDRLVNYGVKRKFDSAAMKETPYDFSYINADLDVPKLTQRLLKCKPGFSICAYGAPGTGKSEYGRALAKKMGKKVLYKRYSDLQSMWLGEGEKNIAKAFAEARDSEMFLIIDEGDSFLQDRKKAQRSWEISQTNEMLSQMESHDQPFLLTTNLMDNLDEASLRRFTFKIKFDFMLPEQAARMFEAYFGMTAPRAILSNFILAPGDFACVKKKVDIMEIDDADEIYALLLDECKLKPQQSNPIGFLAA